jgi:hypothetical protein
MAIARQSRWTGRVQVYSALQGKWAPLMAGIFEEEKCLKK